MAGIKKTVLLCLLLSLPGLLYSQTGQVIEELLNTPAVSCRQAAWLVLEAANTAGPAGFRGQEEAFLFAAERRWLPKRARANARIRLDETALLVMSAFNIKGGALYSLIKNPHYAYRELTYRNILTGRVEPGMDVSGYSLLYLVNRVLAFQDDSLLLIKEPTRDEILAESIRAQLDQQGVTDISVRVTNQGVAVLHYGINFTANSAVLPAAAQQRVVDFARLLTSVNAKRILIAGHTAQTADTAEQHQRLSLERAQTVKGFMVSRGNWDADAIDTVGYGTGRPIADNDTAEGMARNRRVEITILEYQ